MRMDDVAFRYTRKGPWILRDVSLSLPPGRITEVTGHNGVGKSTLLRLVAGLRSPRRGRIIGRPRHVGYAPERFPVGQPFTARSYLSHMAAVRRVSVSAIDDLADRLRFAHVLDVRLSEMSKGSAHKIGLAQAFLAGPGLLVLDEPFAGLDAETRGALPDLLAELAAEGATVVLSDHQRCLDGRPDVHRVRVADGTVHPVTGAEESTPVFPPSGQGVRPAAPESASLQPVPDGQAPASPSEPRTSAAVPDISGPPEPDGTPNDAARDRAGSLGRVIRRTARRTSGARTSDPSAPTSKSPAPAAPAARMGEPSAPANDAAPDAYRTHISDPPSPVSDIPASDASQARVGGPCGEAGGDGAPGLGAAEEGWAVLEVVVRVDEADDVEAKLRADGYRVRRSDR